MANDMLQLLLTGQFYESKLIYSHQGRKANLWLCRFPIHQHTFIALLVILFSNIKWVILVLLMLFFDWYIFLTLTKKKLHTPDIVSFGFGCFRERSTRPWWKMRKHSLAGLGWLGFDTETLPPSPLHPCTSFQEFAMIRGVSRADITRDVKPGDMLGHKLRFHFIADRDKTAILPQTQV